MSLLYNHFLFNLMNKSFIIPWNIQFVHVFLNHNKLVFFLSLFWPMMRYSKRIDFWVLLMGIAIFRFILSCYFSRFRLTATNFSLLLHADCGSGCPDVCRPVLSDNTQLSTFPSTSKQYKIKLKPTDIFTGTVQSLYPPPAFPSRLLDAHYRLCAHTTDRTNERCSCRGVPSHNACLSTTTLRDKALDWR